MLRPDPFCFLSDPKSNITFNSANQMLTFSDKSMTYDENGNLTSITNACGTTTYTWDARNRLVGITGFSADCQLLAANFKYDALGRRIEKTVNGRTIQYIYDGMDIVQEIEGGTVSATYVGTLNIDEPLARLTSNASRFYQTDALGSVIALTDDTGEVKTQYVYDPFGNVAVSGEPSDNPFQYTGRENDGTGLYYYRARYYSPQLQRFISEDPNGLAGGLNFFSYVAGNPVSFIDPFGLDEHHIIPRAIWKELAGLPKEAKDVFEKVVEEGGKHYNWNIHREYSKHVREMWNSFFKGVKPCQISKEMANEFVKTVKSDPKARALLVKLFQKGGAPIPSWLAKGSRVGRIGGGAATAVLFDWMFPNEAQAPTWDDPPLDDYDND